jgi:tetratricopeptide (TPR) repeat protein
MLLLIALLMTSGDAADVATPPWISDADSHWVRRADGSAGALASTREIGEAVAGYERAAQAPDDAEARWKLARALFFQGTYTGLAREARRPIYERARKAGEEAIAIVERHAVVRGAPAFGGRAPAEVAATVASDRDAPPTFFWTAVAWGEWALMSGKIQAAREGAAARIRDYATTVIALAPEFEEGGGYRILGRLHDRAPRIPFLTSWVSREKALANLRRAMSVNSRNFVNRHFLAEALAEGGGAEHAEAIGIEEKLLADPPSSGHLVEDLAVQQEARRDLASWRK